MSNQNKSNITWKENLILRGLRDDFEYVLKSGGTTTITTEKPELFDKNVGFSGEIMRGEWFNLNFDGLVEGKIYEVEELIDNG